MPNHLSGKKFVTIPLNQEENEKSSILCISEDNRYTLKHLKKTNSEFDDIDEGTLVILEEERDYTVAEFSEKTESDHQSFVFCFEFLSPDIGYLKVFENHNHLTTVFFKQDG